MESRHFADILLTPCLISKLVFLSCNLCSVFCETARQQNHDFGVMVYLTLNRELHK